MELESTSSPSMMGDTLSSESLTTRMFKLAMTVDQFYTPILCLFGTIGNCLSIVVFFTKSNKTRSLSSSVYLSALAVSDTAYLINLFIMWLDNMGIGLLTYQCVCSFVMYIGQVTGFLSVWFIVAFTVERLFVVCYPLFRPSKCTASRAKKIATGLTLFAAIAFSYVLIIAQVQVFSFQNDPNSTTVSHNMSNGHKSENDALTPGPEMLINTSFPHFFPATNFLPIDTINIEPGEKESHIFSEGAEESPWENVKNNIMEQHNPPESELVYMCSVPKKYHDISRIYSYIDSILTFIVPFVLISALNMKIILCVRRIKGNRENMLASTKINRQYQRGRPPKTKLKKGLTLDEPMSSRSGRKSKRSMQTSSINEHPSTPSCSNSKSNCRNEPNSEHPRDKSYDIKSCEEVGHRSAIENDSPRSSTGQTTPPFKRVATLPTPTATEIRVTKTLLLVSSVFLVLHLPSHTIRVITFIESLNGGSIDRLRELNVAQHWTNMLFNANFGIHFLLYSCSGKAFRHSIKNLFSKDLIFSKTRKNLRNASTTVITTQLTMHTDSVSTMGKYNTRLKYNSGRMMEEDQL